MFFDQANIHIDSGKGGNGCVSFRREKHVPRGGPDGGDGGRGGNVFMAADPQLRDLQTFTYKVHFKAQVGGHGQGARKHGARGHDVVIGVPLGTQVWIKDELIADIVHPKQRLLVLKGGAGGRGNARFVNSVRQAPKFAELGEAGEGMWLRLSLKLMADAGLAGLPNAGKSSLLKRLSNAKPKVADYPFTTIEPMLGMVDWTGEGDVFALADVPGLLEGAVDGVGLGHEFLAHLERCRLLLHVVDATGYYDVDPLSGFRTILHELDEHGEDLGERPQVILLNKIDALEKNASRELVEIFQAEVARLRVEGHPAYSYILGENEELPSITQLVWPVSAVSGAGIAEFLRWVGPLLHELSSESEVERVEDAAFLSAGNAMVETVTVDSECGQIGFIDTGYQNESVLPKVVKKHGFFRPEGNTRLFVVEKTEEGFSVRGRAVRRLVSRFDLSNEEAVRYLGERLEKLGVYGALRNKGAVPGDDVDIEGWAFEYQ